MSPKVSEVVVCKSANLLKFIVNSFTGTFKDFDHKLIQRIYFVGNKPKWRILKWVFQKNKARQTF